MSEETKKNLSKNDEILFEGIKVLMERGNYDFLHGAIGIGLYLLQSKDKNYIKNLYEFVELMDKSSHRLKNGLAWESIVDYKTKIGYNLSPSHGLASIILFLSKLYKENIYKEKALFLIQGALEFLFANLLNYKKIGVYFPSWVCEGDHPYVSRLGWCYGDLGIGIFLWLTSKNLEDQELEKKSLEILKLTTQRTDIKKESIVDPGLCHGTAGIAHVYSRLYNYTNDIDFKNSAIHWYHETLKMDTFSDGLAGYKIHTEEGFVNSVSLLEGITGIGLSLISALDYQEPSWDGCLMLS